MGSFLENFIESTQSLPTDLYKSLNLMRELDQQCQGLLTDLHGKEQEYLEAMQNDIEPQQDLLGEIQSKQQRAINLSDEKVQLAVQTYDLVDKCIRKLDADLKLFDAQLSAEEREKYNNRKDDFRLQTLNAPQSDMPVDPDEPIYCTCRRVSFGDMVQCDAPHCHYEWFHFECVGVSQAPKGKWYCPQCRGKSSTNMAH